MTQHLRGLCATAESWALVRMQCCTHTQCPDSSATGDSSLAKGTCQVEGQLSASTNAYVVICGMLRLSFEVHRTVFIIFKIQFKNQEG